MPEKKNGFIDRYGINFTKQEYVVNPAIGREKELRELALVLLTPDKSAILTGQPGIGKTAIVEGLAFLIQKGEVPDALKGYTIIKVDTQSMMGTVKETGDSRVQTLVDEILEHEKYILFIDEIHTLVNATSEVALDFANMFKTGLGRGDLKVVGATTSDEYERYILRDKAFTRRFQRIDIAEPSPELTTKIVTGVIPRIEHSTGIKMGYTPFIQEKLARFVVEVTTEYNRVYESAGRYPDVAITMFSQAFSEALFDNKDTVTVSHVRSAIANSKAVYPDVIKKYLIVFDEKFKDLLEDDKRDHSGLDSGFPIREDLLNNRVQVSDDASKETVSTDDKNEIVNNDNINIQANISDDVNNNTSFDNNVPTSGNISVENNVNTFDNNVTDNNESKDDNVIDTMSELNEVFDRIINPFESLRVDNNENN